MEINWIVYLIVACSISFQSDEFVIEFNNK